MAPRRRAPRPWHRTRVYRLTRTIVLTVVLVVSVANWAKDEERGGPHGADLAGARGARCGDIARPGAPVLPTPHAVAHGASHDGDHTPHTTERDHVIRGACGGRVRTRRAVRGWGGTRRAFGGDFRAGGGRYGGLRRV
ncbi:hypothetical protein [Streptomyces ossamyceticus]|uniref:hypothetical protein n=1 Tax=Streptomyces ossamyceticus TaxID=249581 RepID=UPI003EBD854F